MVVTPISKGSKIPTEEKNTAEVLSSLPNNWLCVCGDKDTYFSFLKDNKKIRGTQIDFVIINEYGIFFFEVKNVSVIKTEHNKITFETIDKDEYNPLYRAIEYPNLAKNWFLEKFKESKITRLYKKSDLKFGIWGSVVINNDNYRVVSPQRELKLKDLIHNKQKTIIHRKEINKNFFKKLFEDRKAPHHEKLSNADIFLIYNIMMNQNIRVDSVMTAELERFYEMLKYEHNYKTANTEKVHEKDINAERLKEEKEELNTNIIILKQDLEKERKEREEIENRLTDKSVVIKGLKKENNSLRKENDTLTKATKNYKHQADNNFNGLFNVVKATIKQKEKTKSEKKELTKRLNLTKNIRRLFLVMVPVLVLAITTIVVLSFFLSAELSKAPPSPSETFNDTYIKIRELFHEKDYKTLVDTYNSIDYSFEFLTSEEVSEFRYFIAYSYFKTGENGSSIKDAGVKILEDIRYPKLSWDQILDIYPQVYQYLWELKKYSEAGIILGIIEDTLNERENEMIETSKGFFSLIEAKLFMIKSLSKVEYNNPSQIRVTDHLDTPIRNEVSYIIEDYLEIVYNLLDSKSMLNISKITSSGEYPPTESSKILEDYTNSIHYINEVQGLNLYQYEMVKNRFAELEISLNTELAMIYFFNNGEKGKALNSLKSAEKIFKELRDNNNRINETNLATYIRTFSLLARVYEAEGYLCEAYEAYWTTNKLSPIPNTNLKIKIENLETEINLNETIGGMKNCNFESMELVNKFK